ncbi:hypothetical protein [Cohnella sp. GCM10027633]|uniref:hypothetical protein n=1 Tax=unclassified Cohnella TaxID=2636738 RepID=UPI003628F7DE
MTEEERVHTVIAKINIWIERLGNIEGVLTGLKFPLYLTFFILLGQDYILIDPKPDSIPTSIFIIGASIAIFEAMHNLIIAIVRWIESTRRKLIRAITPPE